MIILISFTEQTDQWFEHFEQLSLDGQYEMFLELLDQQVDDEELLKEEVGEFLVELKGELVRNKQYDKAIQLIEKTKEATDDFYQEEYPYISDFAVEYYLYTRDFSKMHQHLGLFKVYPDYGYDLFLPLFNKIMFFKMDETALDLAEEMITPVIESSELIGGAEIELLDMIFYNAFQVFYLTLEEEENSDIQALKETLKKYGYDSSFMNKELPNIIQTFQRIVVNDSVTAEKWRQMTQGNSRDAVRQLYWEFAVYMWKHQHIHFATSAKLWFPFLQMISEKGTLSDFSFSFSDLDELIGKHFYLFSNEEEKGFAIAWGIPKIYDFLYSQHLVDKDMYDNAYHYVEEIKKSLLQFHSDDAWRFNFVHFWGKPLAMDEASWHEEIMFFNDTFNDREMKESKAASKLRKNNSERLSLFDEPLTKGNKQKKKTKNQKAKKKQAKKSRKKNRKK